MNKTIFMILMGVLLLSACSKKPDVEYTSTYKMAGEWFVKYYTGGSALTDYFKMLSYNTSDPNSGQVWVDDQGTWPLRSKLNVDYANLAFAAMSGASDLADTSITVKVYEGKVLPGQGRSKSGNVVDSIYLRVEFSDDPGTIYELKGHQRTGFFEDEY